MISIDELDKDTGKPLVRASIREADCIGCTKCLEACPVDAIVGASKLMHTVITDECTGCELCVAPCPVDCIDLIQLTITTRSPAQKALARKRFTAKIHRQEHAATQLNEQYHYAKQGFQDNPDQTVSLNAKKKMIEDILARVKNKRK
jgi:electron transport complex protein RnfB